MRPFGRSRSQLATGSAGVNRNNSVLIPELNYHVGLADWREPMYPSRLFSTVLAIGLIANLSPAEEIKRIATPQDVEIYFVSGKVYPGLLTKFGTREIEFQQKG